MTGTTIVIVLAILGVVLFFAWPAFRQLLRIRGGEVVSKGTTPVERNKDRYKQLKEALLPRSATSVAECMATVDDITKDLAEAQAAVVTIQGESTRPPRNCTGSKPPSTPSASSSKPPKPSRAHQGPPRAEATNASKEAQAALDSTVESLQAFADKVADSELNAHLTDAINTSAAAKQQAKDINDKLSEAAEDFDAVDHDLNVARNKAKLADGTAGERELKDIKTKAAAKSGRSKLDALTSTPAAPTTPPAGDTPKA